MTNAQEITLKQLPSLPPLLLKAAISRRKPGPKPVFPTNILRVDGISISQKDVSRYAAACDFNVPAGQLPPSYLHILAFRLQMRMMTQKDFPVSAMGAIHLRNRIRQFRAINISESLSLTCKIAESSVTERGIEFVFLCQALTTSGECVWEDVSRYLSRMKTGKTGAKKSTEQRPPAREFAEQQALSISRQTARQYARASGDFNPIHLHDISAKVLGFRKMIVHGMWSKAYCLAKLYPLMGTENFDCEVEFKTPVFLPSESIMLFEKNNDGIDFELRDKKGRPHLVGEIRA
ncbi:hypothetical protein IB286_11055 [Spongiibacter sp. KMU-158]|uniref:MaoC-like domain-containing protein n=1 Tax=Spongiibacter pelagi TaxID=2760804 RepID=A0A927C1H8_9GAMM|nr:MaoC/PaaZ C-terminal domain-containing protein [Spongiibacter pelagi]MBD2859543.1 hypothetical protein [Spongiibacter pelagi]